MEQRRCWQSLECGLHEFREEMEGIFPPELAGSGHREDPFGESFPRV